MARRHIPDPPHCRPADLPHALRLDAGHALKPAAEVFATPPKLFGSELQFQNFSEAWNYVPFGRYMFNGLFVSVIGTLVVCLTSIFGAYAFARLSLRDGTSSSCCIW